MGFKPVSTEDDIMSANGSNVEFGMFLMECGRGQGDMDVLDGGVSDGT